MEHKKRLIWLENMTVMHIPPKPSAMEIFDMVGYLLYGYMIYIEAFLLHK